MDSKTINDIQRTARIIAHWKTDTMTGQQRAELDAWLAEAPENQQLLDRWKDSDFLTENYIRYNQTNTKAPLKEMNRRIGRHATVIQLRKRYWIAAAAAILALFVVTATLWWNHQENLPLADNHYGATISFGDGEQVYLTDHSEMQWKKVIMAKATQASNSQRSQKPVRISVARGGEYRLSLDDGTKVCLNSASEISYPLSFSGKERKVRLSGEAYFEVTKDEAHPFVVETSHASIHVLGTSFNVCDYPDDQQYAATLVTGRIRLTAQGNSITLEPGMQALIDKQSGLIDTRKVDPAAYTSWIDGKFIFDDMKLTDIARRLSRWYDVEFEFRGGCGEEHFTGAAWKYQPLREVLQDFVTVTNLTITYSEKKIIISPK